MEKEMKSKNTVVYWIKTVLFFVIVGFLSLYILFETFIPEQTVHTFRFKPYVVLTRSMEPVINVDDVVVVTRPDVENLEVGDIITFKADLNFDGNKEVVTHYIYSIEENNAGDLRIRTHRHFEDSSNVTPDTWMLSEDDILGSYMITIPNIGIVIRFLQSPFGLAALVVNAGVIIGVIALIKHDKTKAAAAKKD